MCRSVADDVSKLIGAQSVGAADVLEEDFHAMRNHEARFSFCLFINAGDRRRKSGRKLADVSNMDRLKEGDDTAEAAGVIRRG